MLEKRKLIKQKAKFINIMLGLIRQNNKCQKRGILELGFMT